MKSVLAAESAVFLQFKPIRIILLVLFCVIVSLLALGADKSDLDSCVISHIFRHLLLNLLDRTQATRVPPSRRQWPSLSGWRRAQQKSPLAEVISMIAQKPLSVKRFLQIFLRIFIYYI